MNLERLKKGKLKLLILECLNEKPMHAYEIMKTIEKKFGGIYKPSPGSLYPVLKGLMSQNLIGVEEKDSKKIYYITEDGKKEYLRIKEKVNTFFATHSEYRRLVSELINLGFFLYNYKDILDEEKYKEISEILNNCKKEIENRLNERK
ncbi:PadR family transcriptional regulator [Acidianus brierleyi]|nr:PadR family transcriptional regulator [Acidianus brierleyi]